MNTAVIIAGGSGSRMGQDIPKQFINVYDKPILIYTQLKTGVTPKVNALCTLMFLATLLIVVLSALIGRLGNKKKA